MSLFDELAMKPAVRKQREAMQVPDRLCATLDDIARALELIAMELARRG